jgi:predicted SprT family Zn-dependent metalloprotease
MQVTISQLTSWFNEFKGIVFDNDMPKVKFVLTNTRTQLGRAMRKGSEYTIRITNYYDRTITQFRNTLLHEMCHIWCYYKGYRDDHHTGYNWCQITDKAYRLTGLLITRVSSEKLIPAEHNKERAQAVQAKKNAPAILVDIEYPGYHFIVKTTKNVIWDNCDGAKLKGLCDGKVKGIYICDNPRVLNWQNSRSLHRGYKFRAYEYENEILPILKRGIVVEDLRNLYHGGYDCLGIR